MKTEWMGPVERSFSLSDSNITGRSARYRLDNERERWGHLEFFVPHKLINLLVPNHVPKKVRVTYARLALDINETMQATTPVVPEIWSEKLKFEYRTQREHYYYRQDYKIGEWEFRHPEDLFNGGTPPPSIFIRLCFSG